MDSVIFLVLDVLGTSPAITDTGISFVENIIT